jgi:ankyrin repeat protein
VNAKSEDGTTPLHLAAMFRIGKTKDAELLIAEGANVNAKDDEGSTPLHYVASSGDKEIPKKITELLIAKGADVNAKDVNGKTPLDAAIGAPRRRPKTIDLLRKHGAKTGEELKAEGK